MEKNNLEQYFAKKKERNNLLYDILQKFLELPRECWKCTDPNKFFVMEGDDPNKITEYTAELGPFELSVRSDHTQEESIYRIDIYYKKGALVFHSQTDEAVGFYFNVDGIVRDVGGTFEISELEHDLEHLVNIKEKLNKK